MSRAHDSCYDVQTVCYDYLFPSLLGVEHEMVTQRSCNGAAADDGLWQRHPNAPNAPNAHTDAHTGPNPDTRTDPSPDGALPLVAHALTGKSCRP